MFDHCDVVYVYIICLSPKSFGILLVWFCQVIFYNCYNRVVKSARCCKAPRSLIACGTHSSKSCHMFSPSEEEGEGNQETRGQPWQISLGGEGQGDHDGREGLGEIQWTKRGDAVAVESQ